MRVLIAGLMLALAACGPRQVEVRTSPEESRAPAMIVLHVTNNLGQAVNVYVVAGPVGITSDSLRTDSFIRQVPGNTTMDLPVPNIAPGTRVTLKATTIEGTRTFTRRDVTLNGRYNWSLP